MNPDLVARARAWQAEDPDPATRVEIDRIIAHGDEQQLADRFSGCLQFGTAGLRGPVGAGPNRMNRASVRRATAGLIAYLDEESVTGPIVIGRDERNGSAEFLEEAVAVVGGAGREVIVLPEPCPTPLCAFAVLETGAAAGIQITASHNPPSDNGYKVYLADGAQVAPPIDAQVSEKIGAVTDLALVPLDPSRPTPPPADLVDRYLDVIVDVLDADAPRRLRLAYTPMHGVGGQLALRAFERAGFDAPAVVAEQFMPDPDFPTLRYPNPEEPGAMDLLLALAESHDADLALAHDPDADRLGAAVPDSGGWRRLRGDEIGVLLADHLMVHRSAPDPVVAMAVACSRMLPRLAEARGVRCIETLTGFKWVARASADLLFGYEEALGYAVTPAIRDKDGISAALVLAEAAATLASKGKTLLDRLDELDAEVGVHETDQLVVRAGAEEGMENFEERLDAIRHNPPGALGGLRVEHFEDLAEGRRFHPANVLIFDLPGARVVLRPSGTEPKLKCNLEATEPPGGDTREARNRARQRLDTLRSAVAELMAAGSS